MTKERAIEILRHIHSPDEEVMAVLEMAANAIASNEQIRWERDTAIDQLGQLGYGLGEEIKTPSDGDLVRWTDAVRVIFNALLTIPDTGDNPDNMSMAIAMAEKIPPVRRWIKADKASPKDFHHVLGWIERNKWGADGHMTLVQEYAVGWCYRGKWHFNGYPDSAVCLAWMPLPDKYREA